MTATVRRVVADHDGDGKAVITKDERMELVKRPRGASMTVVWATDRMPIEIVPGADRAETPFDIVPSANGSVLRVLDLPPTPEVFMHRTETVDYAIVLKGECDMLLDDSEVHLEAGDILIQKGTWHGWANRGTETCRIAFVLLDAEPLPFKPHEDGTVR